MFRLLNKAGNAAGLLSPASDVLVRFIAGFIFFSSGYNKLQNYLNDQWSNTVMLFEDIHPVPFMPAEYAAISGTAAEIILPILLVLGLFGRLSALGLIVVTLVIISTGMYSFNPPADAGTYEYIRRFVLGYKEALILLALLGTTLTHGPGNWSLDRLFVGKREEL